MELGRDDLFLKDDSMQQSPTDRPHHSPGHHHHHHTPSHSPSAGKHRPAPHGIQQWSSRYNRIEEQACYDVACNKTSDEACAGDLVNTYTYRGDCCMNYGLRMNKGAASAQTAQLCMDFEFEAPTYWEGQQVFAQRHGTAIAATTGWP